MKSKYPCLITSDSIILVKGKPLVANISNPNFKRIKELIKERRYNNIERLFNIKEDAEKIFNVVIKDKNTILYKDKPLNNALTKRIISCIKEGKDYKPWVNFLNKLMENPSEYCREQLFSFVDKYGLPIDASGFVYSWKAVTSNFWDKHTGKTHQYKVGSIIQMKREDCDSNPEQGCGAGLHCGDVSYVAGFGGGDDKYVLVRFSPKDVISCPADCSWKKIRLCKLRVMREVKKDEIFPLGDSYMGKKGKLPKRNSLGQFVSAS